MNELYGYELASAYDDLNDSIDYAGFASFYEKCVEYFSDIPVSEILETACGTGSLACELARRGYSVTASDISSDMLSFADEKARSAGLSIRFVLQDMCHTQMYSQKDLCVCMLDSVNYLIKKDDVMCFFESVYSSLRDGALFIFDANSAYKFENVYGNNSYIIDDDGVFCGWSCDYNAATRICDLFISIFKEESDGKYIRSNEYQREKMYTVRQFSSYLEKAGFELCGIFSDFDLTLGDESRDERLFYVAKKIKKD